MAGTPLQSGVRPQRILLLRHGESQGNISRHDIPDPNLTDLGIAQAKSWADEIGEFGAELVLVSPLRRTVQTACYAFAREEAPLLICRNAREIGWCAAENTIMSSERSMSSMLDVLPRGNEVQGVRMGLRPQTVDPVDEVACMEELKKILRSRPERTLAVVCHFGVINALIGNRAKNADIFECEWGSDGELHAVGRHRPPLEQQQCLCH